LDKIFEEEFTNVEKFIKDNNRFPAQNIESEKNRDDV
jgi:hypothetical protein